MRNPIEKWLKEHREMLTHADRMVELLAPDDIQTRLSKPDEMKLRHEIADCVEKIGVIIDPHIEAERMILFPMISDHFGRISGTCVDTLSCLGREHEQLGLFFDRAKSLLPSLKNPEPLEKSVSAELLRVCYGIHTVLTYHCPKEETEVYSLVGKLPLKSISKLAQEIGLDEDIEIDHLIKPLGEDKGSMGPDWSEREAPDN
ncbi:MAG: hemerythrin domain-containing protein [bacterium]